MHPCPFRPYFVTGLMNSEKCHNLKYYLILRWKSWIVLKPFLGFIMLRSSSLLQVSVFLSGFNNWEYLECSPFCWFLVSFYCSWSGSNYRNIWVFKQDWPRWLEFHQEKDDAVDKRPAIETDVCFHSVDTTLSLGIWHLRGTTWVILLWWPVEVTTPNLLRAVLFWCNLEKSTKNASVAMENILRQ